MNEITLSEAIRRLEEIEKLAVLGHDQLLSDQRNRPWDNATANHNFVHGMMLGFQKAAAIARGKS